MSSPGGRKEMVRGVFNKLCVIKRFFRIDSVIECIVKQHLLRSFIATVGSCNQLQDYKMQFTYLNLYVIITHTLIFSCDSFTSCCQV
jgi:hypothetical protein